MLASPALKKLPLPHHQREDVPHTTPIKPLELPEHTPIIDPVEIKPPTAGGFIPSPLGLTPRVPRSSAPVTCRSTSSPGPAWDLVEGHEPSVQGEHIRQGLYRFNPAKAKTLLKLAEPTWLALNRWRTGNSGLPPRPPAQAGVRIKD